MCHCLHAESDLCCASLNPAACSGRSVLRSVFDEVIEVDALDSADSVHLALMQRPELGVTFTKLHCWTLTHYSKCVFMDADTLVSRAGAVETFVSVSKTLSVGYFLVRQPTGL